MNYIKKFKLFLEKINIDFEQYANCTITDKNGNEYLFSQIDEEKIKSFEWAYFLAEHNQIILLNNTQETMDSIKAIREYQNGRLGTIGKHYDSEYKAYDGERFDYAKDIYYLIRDTLAGKRFGNTYPMYLEDGSADNFLICLASLPNTKGLMEDLTKHVKKLATKLGLYIFPISAVFPKRLVKPFSQRNCEIGGVLIEKNHRNEDRNAYFIAQCKAKLREKRAKQMDFVMTQEEDAKFTAKAKKLYDEIKVYGLDGIAKESPRLGIGNYLIDVFKILLYKKWVSYKNIVNLEVDAGYFFHMYEDRYEIPAKQDLIFEIIDEVEERYS
ncbi:MAG: hypothetical protein HDT28_05585 [Clostridiales bacterium]|nr:hypothetical protein [Clostridiales bacterium]